MNAPLTLEALPLFPLHTVLFPAGYLPLRVFEPRYRSMVRNCREQGAPFGVVTLLTGDEVRNAGGEAVSFHRIGTMASIDAVSPLSSGLELLQCTGRERFRITASRKQHEDLWVADVELLSPDTTTPIPHDLQPTAKALRHILRKKPQRDADADADAVHDTLFADSGWVANRWCELLPMSQQMQLQLLELDSPLLRLELVTDALENAGILS